ncbi:hypothetical protein C9397_16000 [Xanthomonas vasicola pv. vasculorum]|uniref:Uncharacterized protein n=1 Tax=Xanthomonas vasicola pv. vasculorum TaxID=325776 RepID=A0AAE8F776_XANVA|nr:hypothetical protein C7V42_07390 [Xanthomonas vasicola pv. vasculorum]AZR26071.1 hypothetical protein NX80_005805 [Xanthomonas vasicola pv. arecae]AZR31645.1 hypothetical protein KWO_015025 [Xanthomonas vasicola pv. musacearum NCPPB 4379]AZR34287.1 hypothetical protein NX08_007155 [Xanthomonas vasicola]RRJ44656.1 hypothetical protein EIM46_00350 [Xanthomonas vasicola pv. musacearum]
MSRLHTCFFTHQARHGQAPMLPRMIDVATIGSRAHITSTAFADRHSRMTHALVTVTAPN